MKPIVAIVGRANVGKSTLFNRIVGSHVAIVEDMPGTTRDRIIADAEWQGRKLTFVDTGGLEMKADTAMMRKVTEQAVRAIAEADVIVFVVDIRDGVIVSDSEIAAQLHATGKPVILAANKADTSKPEQGVAEFFKLGLGEPTPVSGIHGRNVDLLLDRIVQHIPESTEPSAVADNIKLAIVGRPNAGKSTLLNAITGKDRAIVDSTPGTTRDAIDSAVTWEGHEIVLIDTAGIRRRGKTGTGIDYYSLIRAMHAINRCDIALLVVDATELLTAQDTHIAGYIKDASKGMMLIVNKWDLVPEQPKERFDSYIAERLKFASFSPVLYVSAKNKQGVDKILPIAFKVWDERQKKMPDAVVNKLIKDAVLKQAPTRVGTKRLVVIRAYQAGVNPPKFLFLVNDPELVHFSYERYLENKLRQTFGFIGTSLRLVFIKAPARKRRRLKQ